MPLLLFLSEDDVSVCCFCCSPLLCLRPHRSSPCPSLYCVFTPVTPSPVTVCAKKCRRCVLVVVRQCVRTVSCLSVTFFLISRHRVIEMLPHDRFQTRWSVRRFTNLATQYSLATCSVYHFFALLQVLHPSKADDVTLGTTRRFIVAAVSQFTVGEKGKPHLLPSFETQTVRLAVTS